MAATEVNVLNDSNTTVPAAPSDPVGVLADSLAKANVQPEDKLHEKPGQPPRELHIYAYSQLLRISRSPLVKPPEGMPALKEWFGCALICLRHKTRIDPDQSDWSEQQIASKKEGDPSSNGTSARDRRFRRDPEEGDAPTRPSFRSSLSQPSQMGNFRHQSLRTADRERERDPERERQRDERDREGQERLRNLSDKYDRERLALSSATSTLRGKERESAPHLAGAARNGQGQATSVRRAEGRETAKKKAGEASDDWRRGAEPPSRGGRDDRSDTNRRDRDRKDTSRTRRDPSGTRRDRDNKERDRSRRGDERDDRRDRDDYFRRDWDDRDDGYRDRDRYDYNRRDVDRDRDLDEDPRRWRDDGKRDERVAVRRERERERDRGWDRWEPSHDRERLDDRDGRAKRSGRDRRSGAGLDDAKDKEEKKEREKEKEPAWMETYIPTTPGGGILGGQSTDGELDGIQAWKRGLKEKERKEKEAELADESTSNPAAPVSDAPPTEIATGATAEGSLDEIQIFKMLMKKEAAKKDTEQSQESPVSPSSAISTTVGRTSPAKLKDPALAAISTSTGSPALMTESNSMAMASSGTSPTVARDGVKLLSLLSQAPGDGPTAPTSKFSTPNISTPDTFPSAVSRMFPTPPGLSPSVSQNSERPTIDLSIPSYPTTPFEPPSASRLLAFGSRAVPGVPQLPPSKTLPADPNSLPFGSNHPSAMGNPGQRPLGVNALGSMSGSAGVQQGSDLMFNMDSESHMIPNRRATPSERSTRSFSPFGQSHQQAFGVHDGQDTMRLPQTEAMRRMAPERGVGIGPDTLAGFPELSGGPASFNPGMFELSGSTPGAASSAAKGSRFAKFFDQKNREAQAHAQAQAMRKASGGNGFISTSPLPGQGRDAMNGMTNSTGENRTMEDIFAMLQSSSQLLNVFTQNHRASPQLQQSGRVSAAGAPHGQAPIDLQVLQQHHLQQLHQQQLMQQSRLDSLYDSRMDDRSFVPDGMVPGLRPAPRPRSREPVGLHVSDHLDEPLQVNPRLAQQQRALEQLYNGPTPSAYGQQANIGRNLGGIQQNQFRGGPGMLPVQNLPQAPSHRLPPGLANLGGRPPHDASQFLNNQLNNLPPHGSIHTQQQQSLNNFGGAGFNGPIQRSPISAPHHNSPVALNQLGGMGPGNGIDLRIHNQAQLLGLGNTGGMGGGPRSAGVGFNGQHSSVAQLQAQQLALRQQQQQQQQQQLQQLGMPPAHLLPPHIQQQHQQNMHANSQGAQDLMALLMGGQRE
ncbi:uncharacterized protein PHACADRAFT_24203 [Phanerochaete carnosa HHB-10118-sp]|uniref:Uncharacterized protein n=1 Tax=Phanerochaete carnosa (strain HHB-10118-sp) TaxID=650164 RepID=K5WAL6_PHACS|nr:uncharacterized protein PHACADRAFT_24203 [Phanerochaete carnosa HHB-10118-sp]EKM60978.1 hypothetical protein PHACADRAFT_24203 [Phanerochaete carnosa HHB-10118-sp]